MDEAVQHQLCRAINGISYDPFNVPDELLFDEHVIAHALSNQCRFAGHVSEFLSVAHHCLCVCDLLRIAFPDRRDLHRWGLMHDAVEAFMQDIIRPTKVRWRDYQIAEATNLERLAQLHGLPWPMPREVKEADDFLLKIEDECLRPRERGMASAMDTASKQGSSLLHVRAIMPFGLHTPGHQVRQIELIFAERTPRKDCNRWLKRFDQIFCNRVEDGPSCSMVTEIEPVGRNV